MARKRKDDSALVLVGGKKPQMREASKTSWTNAKEAEFLTVLAETCNVTQAAAEAGVSSSAAYRRRKENAAFRAAWLEAISVAYQRLELVLLERAFNGTEKLIKRRDGSEERMLEYSNQLGLTLLKMHRDTAVEASTEIAPDQIEELRERLPGTGISRGQRRRAGTRSFGRSRMRSSTCSARMGGSSVLTTARRG